MCFVECMDFRYNFSPVEIADFLLSQRGFFGFSDNVIFSFHLNKLQICNISEIEIEIIR